MARREAPDRSRTRRFTCAAFLFPVIASATYWAIDALHMVLPHHPSTRQLVLGLGLGLLFVLGAAAAVGMVSALLTWLALSGPSDGGPRFSARLSRWLSAREPEVTRARAALLCGLALCLAVYLVATRLITEQIILHMARPGLAALAVMATQVLLALALTVLFAPFVALGSLLVRAAHRVPRLGASCFGEPLRCAILLACAGIVVCIQLLVQYRAALRFLPWRSLEWGTGALLVSALALWQWPALSRTARRGLTVLSLSVLGGASATALTVGAHDRAAHDIAERKLSSARSALDILHFVGDVDRDGHLGLLGGDCAAWDSAIYPGAIDIPGNGTDEDCDGVDATLGTFALTNSAHHPVPNDVPERPPILLITVDAFAASHMGSFGYEREVTPELDAFARRSALFRGCYAQGPSTRLSFPSMFTSHWDSQLERVLVGRHPYPLHSSEQTLAELLRDAGYDTTAILSEAYFTPQRWRGLTSGFDTLSRTPLEQEVPHNASAVTDAALSALSQAGDKPKFVWAHYFDAHPVHERPRGIASYGDSESDLYDAELRLVDRELGRLVRKVDELFGGQALVVVTGDHGIAFDEPRHEGEHYGYDLSSAVLHVPLIVHAPFVAPRSFDHVVSTMDIAPTLANLLRLDPARPLYGSSLVPELLSGVAAREGMLFHQFFLLERMWERGDPLVKVSLRTDRFNLIHDRVHDQYELYDYKRDPLEANDLTLSDAYSDIFGSLKGALHDFTYAVHRSARQPAAALR